MTTEPGSDDRAARLAALQQRRTARTNDTPRRATSGRTATLAPRAAPRTRRRHAAARARILAGCLSAATALGLVGAMAGGFSATTSAPTSEATPAPSSARTVTIGGESGSRGSTQYAGTSATQAPAAPRVAPSVAAPATTSRGS